MPLKTQHIPLHKQSDNDVTLVSLDDVRHSSHEDQEFRERHGEKYHLRHHLSGCAQTLYTIDFTNDFSAPAAAPSAVSAFLPPLPDVKLQGPVFTPAPSNQSEGNTDVSTLTLMHEASLHGLQHNIHSPALFSEVRDHAEKHHTEIKGEPVYADMQRNSSTASDGLAAENSGGIRVQADLPHVADFNDGTLGGWSLHDDLTMDKVLQDGQLHFVAEDLHNGRSLLSQFLALTAGQSYKLQMSVQTTSDSEAPQFGLDINGVTFAMDAVREGDRFVLKVEFVAPQTEAVNLSIVPAGSGAVLHDIWLDDLIIMRSGLSSQENPSAALMSVMIPEPLFDFASLSSEIASPAEPAGPPPDIASLLQDVHPSLFLSTDTTRSVLFFDKNIDISSDYAHTSEWSDFSGAPGIFADTLQTEWMEMSPLL